MNGEAYGVNPEPGTVASALWAGGQLRHREFGVEVPDAGLINREDREVLGLESIHVGLVRDSERAALDIILASRVEGGKGGAGAGGVAAVPNVPANRKHVS